MSKIVISGYYGFANAGDEAMLTAIVKSLRKTEASVDLTVISGNPQSTATKHLVNSVHHTPQYIGPCGSVPDSRNKKNYHQVGKMTEF